MSTPADNALRQLERALSRDPVVREIIGRTLPRSTRSGRFSPEVDVVEHDDQVLVLLDLPGVPRDTIEVEIRDGRLLVSGQKPALHPEGGRVRSAERGAGAFKREFLLPCPVSAEGVAAKLKDGVLTVTIPRVGAARPYKVQVD